MPGDRSFPVLFVALVVLRIGLLIGSQHSLCGDEAAVGLMTWRIVDAGERPVFAHSVKYNGGAAVTAYIATIPFALLGMSEIALKLVPLTFGLSAVLTVFLLVRSARGPQTAFLVALLYGTSVMLMKWNFDARGGYAECQLLIPLLLWLLYGRCLSPKGRLVDDGVLGLLCGFGFYVFPLFLVAGLTAMVFLLGRSRQTGRILGLGAWAAGTLLGAFPLIYFRADMAPLGGFDFGRAIQSLAQAPLGLARSVVFHLPRSLTYANLDEMPPMQLVPNGIEYLTLVAGITILLAKRRRDLVSWWRSLGPPKRAATTLVPLEAVLWVYAFIYLSFYSLHPLAGEEARHLVFLEPVLSALTGLGLAAVLFPPVRQRPLVVVAIVLLALSLGNRGWQHVRLMGDRAVYGPLGRSDPGEADSVIAFLDAQGVDRIMTEDWDLSWRIAFKTRDRISSTHSTRWLSRLFRQASPRERARYALVLAASDPEQDRIRHRLSRRGLNQPTMVAGHPVYLLRDVDPNKDRGETL